MKHIYLSVFSLMAVSAVFAQKNRQSIVETAPATPGKMTGVVPQHPKGNTTQNKAVLFSESFNGSLGAMTGGGVDGALWQLDLDGPNGAFSDPVAEIITSTTVANGFAIFDTDLSNPDAANPTPRVGQLVSPVIDMSANPLAVINFQHAFRWCCSNVFLPKLEVSTDGFNTVAAFDVSNGAGVNAGSGTVSASINISGFLDTAANLNNFQFRFNWDGTPTDVTNPLTGATHYYWQIDDIEVSTPPDNDLELAAVVWGTTGVWGTVNYSSIPKTQLTPISSAGFIQNNGGMAQDAVFSASSPANAYTASSTPVNIPIMNFDFLTASPDYTISGTGKYVFDFAASSATADANPGDNTASDSLVVTDYIYAVDDGSFTYGNHNSGQPYEIGNIFNIINAQTLYAADFRISNLTELFSAYYIRICEVDTSKALENMFTEVYRESNLTATQKGLWVTVPFTTPVNLSANKAYAIFLGSPGDMGATNAFAYTVTDKINVFYNSVFIDYTDTTYYTSDAAALLRMNFTPPPVITSSDADNIICAPGTVTLTSSALTGNTWSTGEQTRSITVSTGGTYTVTAGGMTSQPVTVVVNTADAVTSAVATNPTSCLGSDGKIDVTVAGAGGGTLIWSGVASGSMSGIATSATISTLTAGGYSVTYDNGLCVSDPVGVALSDPGAVIPVITASGSTTFCAGGSVDLMSSVTGGNIWSNMAMTDNITVTTAGSYYVANNTTPGCIGTSNVITVVVNPLPNVDAGADISICAGQSVTLAASGSGSYSWDNGVSDGVSFVPTTTTTYTVTGMDLNFCSNSDQVTVTVNAYPTVAIDPITQVCVYDAPVTLTATPAGGVFSGTGVSGGAFNPAGLPVGTYSVTYSVAVNGCSGTGTASFALDSCLSVSTIEGLNLDVFPNPVMNGQLHLSGDQLSLFNEVTLIDQLGREVVPTQRIEHQSSVILNMNSISAGTYFLKLSGDSHEQMVKIQKL